jgi:dTMP kinase
MQGAPHTARQTPAFTGLFLSLEGVDGAGKTTQCARLAAALEAQGREVVRLREPGGTAVGERVRDLLLQDEKEPLDPVCELLLYEASRAQLVSRVVRPALARGATVLSDRFLDSTTAYQGAGRGLGEGAVRRANELACGGTAPHRTLVLDLDARRAWERATAGGADRMEAQGWEFMERVRAGFLACAEADPRRVRVVDADGTADEVWGRICAELEDLTGPLALPCGGEGR